MSIKRIKNLVKQLNEYRHAYYNQDAPLVSDSEYDRLFDELKELEEQTGFILSNSPTQTVGYYPVSELAKVTHPIPLLSLEKTKLISELLDFMKGQEVLFMLKLDGLTTKLIYEDGRLIQASTRGDGEVGEDITHNIPAFLNVPLTIPHKERLVITGESFIPTNDFERLKDTLRDGNGKPYKNGRNFASGSVRSLDPKNCIGRCVRFLPFNVLEGMEDVPFPDSRACKLEGLTHLGFGYCPFFSISETGLSREYVEKFIQELVSTATNLHLPIDGIVMIFDSLSYSKSCGKTGHHYKDGLAYKFEDDTYETFLREIEWTPTRFGEIAPVGIFDTVKIDGCDVSRASLHNLTFIKNLELVPGCRILVSKRNMIIPHIEDNLDRGRYTDITPRGDYAFLSNFYPAPVSYMGQTYANNEAAFQAQKTFSAREQRKFCIFRMHNPSDAKKLGRDLTLRPDWEKVKVRLMYEICMCKFMQNPELRDKLLATGESTLVEGNNWGDYFLGKVNNCGENQLGIILMDVRAKLQWNAETAPNNIPQCLQ